MPPPLKRRSVENQGLGAENCVISPAGMKAEPARVTTVYVDEKIPAGGNMWTEKAMLHVLSIA